MANSVKVVLFDVDGTILDSVPEGKKRIIDILRENGFIVPEDIMERFGGNWQDGQQIKKGTWGLPGVEMMELAFGLDRATSERLYREWEVYDIAHPLPLVEGTENMLKTLTARGLVLGIVTSRRRNNLISLLTPHDILQYFDVELIQAKDDCPFFKPDPRTFSGMLQKLFGRGISMKECVYVGDTQDDFNAASKCGIPCVSVCTGDITPCQFKAYGQHISHIIHSVGEFPQWLDFYLDTRRPCNY